MSYTHLLPSPTPPLFYKMPRGRSKQTNKQNEQTENTPSSDYLL